MAAHARLVCHASRLTDHCPRENLYPHLEPRLSQPQRPSDRIDLVQTDGQTDQPTGGVTRDASHPEHVGASGWAWRWTGWASWRISPAVLWVCALAVVVDVGTSWVAVPTWYLGVIALSPALPLGVALVALIGPRRLGFSRRSILAWREFLMIGGSAVLVWCISYPQSVAEFRDVEGIVVAVAGEELIYRLAAVVLIGAACARIAGRNWRDTAQWGTGPAIGGLVGAGLVFSSLPGHVDQMNGATNVLPFLSLAVLLGYTALRCGSIIPGFLVHLAIDLAALAYFAGALPNSLRVLVDVGSLIALVLGLMLAGRRLGLRRRMPRVIDLRQPAPVTPTTS